MQGKIKNLATLRALFRDWSGCHLSFGILGCVFFFLIGCFYHTDLANLTNVLD